MSFIDDLMAWIDDFIAWIRTIFPKIWQFIARAVKAILGKIHERLPSFGPMIDNLIKSYLEIVSIKSPVLGDTMKKIYVSVRKKATLWFFDERAEITVMAGGQGTENVEALVKTVSFKDLPASWKEEIKREKAVEVTEIVR